MQLIINNSSETHCLNITFFPILVQSCTMQEIRYFTNQGFERISLTSLRRQFTTPFTVHCFHSPLFYRLSNNSRSNSLYCNGALATHFMGTGEHFTRILCRISCVGSRIMFHMSCLFSHPYYVSSSTHAVNLKRKLDDDGGCARDR